MCDLHAAREYHRDTIAVCDAFVERMSGKREINLTERRSKRNHPEQQKEALLYYRDNCLGGRQNIALRGHRDSAQIWKVYKQQA